MDPISVEISLLSGDDIPNELPVLLKQRHGGPVRLNGWIWRRAGEHLLRWKDDDAGETLFQDLAREGRPAGDSDPWRMLLDGETPPYRLSGMRDGTPRCVILLEAVPDQEKLLSSDTVAELAPMEQGDAVTQTAPGKIVLIKAVKDHTEDEIREYAAAVIETVETEAGIPVQAGIGCAVTALAALRSSYQQAEQAVAIGRRFRLEGTVFEYGRQITERLIDAVPPEERRRIRRDLFTAETEKTLTGEMMETVHVFFRNDLNLSTAARQLYIHRNTLIYRLDKIRKATGFDLRKFEDAAAFRLLCRIPADHENTRYRED